MLLVETKQNQNLNIKKSKHNCYSINEKYNWSNESLEKDN